MLLGHHSDEERVMTDENAPQPPSSGTGFAVPDSISGDAEFWKVVRGAQALRDNEGSTPADIHFLLAELVDTAAEPAWLKAADDVSLESMVEAILAMIGENDMARMHAEDQPVYRRLYEEGERRFHPHGRGRQPLEEDPFWRAITDPTRSGTGIWLATLREAQRRRDTGSLPPKAAFFAVGRLVTHATQDRLAAERGKDQGKLDDKESQRAVTSIAAEVAEQFGEDEMADLIANDWPEFQHRYAEGKAAFDAVAPKVAVQ